MDFNQRLSEALEDPVLIQMFGFITPIGEGHGHSEPSLVHDKLSDKDDWEGDEYRQVNMDTDWLVLETGRGMVVYKQYWHGSNVSLSEVSADFDLTEEEAQRLSENIGDYFGESIDIVEPKHFETSFYKW